MNRDVTNFIRWILDEWMPPLIRDSEWFMKPLFHYWFKGEKINEIMHFKKIAYKISEKEFNDFYKELVCRDNRVTGLNAGTIKQILKHLPSCPAKILEVGCGKGYLLSKIKEHGHLVKGSDIIDANKIDVDFDYIQCSISNLPFVSKSFDIVVCAHVLEHIPNIIQAIEELKRVALKQLFIVVPCQRYNYYTLDLHLHFFPFEESLVNMIGLKDFKCENINGDLFYIGNLIQ